MGLLDLREVLVHLEIVAHVDHQENQVATGHLGHPVEMVVMVIQDPPDLMEIMAYPYVTSWFSLVMTL